MPRCCDPAARDLASCYASVLVVGGTDLAGALQDIEGSPICPCVTGWCARCGAVSVLTSSADEFPCPSAYFAHALALHARVEGTLQAVRRERCR
jgi:hypothetical protein